jgi:hypothetical protein
MGMLRILALLLILILLLPMVKAQSLEIVGNGDFETDVNGDNIPESWLIKGGKRVCLNGNCEYKFVGNGISQSIAQTYIIKGGDGRAGDTLNVSIGSRWKNWTGRKVLKLVTFYNAGAPGVLKVPLAAATNTGSMTAARDYGSVKIKILAYGLTGRLWIDNVSAQITRN